VLLLNNHRWGSSSHVVNMNEQHLLVAFFLNPMKCESMNGRVSLRIQQLNVSVETKSKDNVFVHIEVAVQYQVIWEKVFDAHYRLMNPKEQITAFVFDVVRNEVPKINLDDIFLMKDDIAIAVKDELTKMMEDFGFEILKTLITDINPNQKVKEAMNDINAAERLKAAAKDKAEAQKISVVKHAEAESESKYLSGVGVARQRMAIIDGLKDSVISFSHSVEGSSAKEVMDLVLLTQYFDMLKEIGIKSDGSTIFVQHSPAAVSGIAEQIRQGFMQVGSEKEKEN